MEEVVRRDNLLRAYHRVKQNQGAAGVDGMSVEALPEVLRERWEAIREALLNGTYEPQAVRGVSIPKPGGQGVRVLGIPMAYAYCISLPRRLGIAIVVPTSTNSQYQLT